MFSLKFLFNLFYDRAILNLPNPFRYMLARWISFARTKKAKGIYAQMGGKSPILENTLRQAKGLKKSLEDDFEVMVISAMRYWHPRTIDALEVANAFKPNKVVLLPLYPQFSTTTTASSIKEWKEIAPQWPVPGLPRFFGLSIAVFGAVSGRDIAPGAVTNGDSGRKPIPSRAG